MDNINEFVNKAISATSGEAVFNGKHFLIRYYSGSKALCAYANNGMTSIYSQADVEPKDLPVHAAVIAERIREYLDGYIHCSNCGKLISADEKLRTFFAGTYCEECWESHYKDLASTPGIYD